MDLPMLHTRPFSANTGQVLVKIHYKRWPAGQPVSDASTVEQIKVAQGSCRTLCAHPGAPRSVPSALSGVEQLLLFWRASS
jgi:hypothetical protein